MSGPIVRTGTNPKFWQNWDKVFGGKKKKAAETKTAKPKAAAKAKSPKAKKKTAAKKKK
jgi:hypothetical protein